MGQTDKQHYQNVSYWMTMTFLVILGAIIPNVACASDDDERECFYYEDDSKTVITGLTQVGTGMSQLTIPSTVTYVDEYALSDAGNNFSSLIIDGGNPEFNNLALYGVQSKVRHIEMGSGMSVANMRKLIICVGSGNHLETINIDGYTPQGDINWEDMDTYLSSDVVITMPAELVDEQVFGNAEVYGRFDLRNPLSTFCYKQSFYDISDGANFLFYLADELRSDPTDGLKKLHLQRVFCIVGGEGVLAHNVEGTSSKPELPRVWGNSRYSQWEDYSYSTNMLVGVLADSTITATDGNYTNMILYNGTFYPTTGGTLGAHRAFLQVPTTELENLSNLTLLFDNNTEDDGIEKLSSEAPRPKGWYSISGQRFDRQPSQPGLYIHDGHAVTIK